jgi:hypothetical protein
VVERDPPPNDHSCTTGGSIVIVPEEHRAAVLKAFKEAERGEFASDEEMTALWKRYCV